MRDALSGADPAAPVPTCPDWTVGDLATHIVTIHRWAGSILLSGVRQKEADVRRFAELPDWYAAAAAALLAALEAVDPDEPCWNFARVEQRAGFWRRRQLHETQMHAIDVRLASGAELPPIDARVAADGVDEAFTVFLPRLLRRGFPPAVTVPVTVAATDTDDVWTLIPGDEPDSAPAVRRTESSAAARISGPALGLYLAIWKRASANQLLVAGDQRAGRDFLAAKLTA